MQGTSFEPLIAVASRVHSLIVSGCAIVMPFMLEWAGKSTITLYCMCDITQLCDIEMPEFQNIDAKYMHIPSYIPQIDKFAYAVAGNNCSHCRCCCRRRRRFGYEKQSEIIL